MSEMTAPPRGWRVGRDGVDGTGLAGRGWRDGVGRTGLAARGWRRGVGGTGWRDGVGLSQTRPWTIQHHTIKCHLVPFLQTLQNTNRHYNPGQYNATGVQKRHYNPGLEFKRDTRAPHKLYENGTQITKVSTQTEQNSAQAAPSGTQSEPNGAQILIRGPLI